MSNRQVITVERMNIRALVALVLVAMMLLLAASDLLAVSCSDHCESECDDSCESYGGCVNCLPTIHMLDGSNTSLALVDLTCGWTLSLPCLRLKSTLPVCIDHPPQNLS